MSEWGDYVATPFASHGDVGSTTLKPIEAPTTWHAGATAEVAWQVTANHGGGYAYRRVTTASNRYSGSIQE